jgi:S1-C subfamily serine protease
MPTTATLCWGARNSGAICNVRCKETRNATCEAPRGAMRFRGIGTRLARLFATVLAFFLLTGNAHGQRLSTGSGFYITADGYALTCYHVIVGARQVSVRDLKGITRAAQVIAVDKTHDLALLKIVDVPDGIVPLPLVPSSTVRRGQAVVTMGFPNVSLQGAEPKVTDGIINSFSGVNNDARTFQFSAPVQTGNSGGPLVTMEGNVVGIVAAKLDAAQVARTTGDIPQNVNYAIKSQHALDLLEAFPQAKAGVVAARRVVRATVADVVPPLEDALLLVLASPQAPPTAGAAPPLVLPAPRPPAAAPTPAPTPQSTAQPPASQPTAPSSPPPSSPSPSAAPPSASPQFPPSAVAPAVPPAVPPPTQPVPDAQKRQQQAALAQEYRTHQRELQGIQFEELSLMNRAQLIALMRRAEGGATTPQRDAELKLIRERMDALGSRRAELAKLMNTLAQQYRELGQ